MRLRLLCLGALLMFAPLPAFAAFDAGFAGYWGGTGTVEFVSASEHIKCHSSIKLSDGGATLVMNVRCSNPSTNVDVGVNLASAGTQVTGTWTIKTHDITGSVAGTLSNNAISARVKSDAFTAQVSIVKTGASMAVEIRTIGSASVKKMSLALNRKT